MTKTTNKSKLETILSDGLLGTMPDCKLARKYGVYDHEVSTIRRLAGVDRFSKEKGGGSGYDENRLTQIEDMLVRVAETQTTILSTLRNKGVM